ncbi:MAG TPA: penicillin-binding transpeptidase domain-containing protein [Chloroflexota bacterium]
MDRRLGRLITFILLAFGTVAAGLGYWQVGAAPELVADPRLNGYRIAQQLREDLRGRIVDRTGQPLAEAVKGPDGYNRRYQFPGAFPISGYWSLRYGAAGLEGKYDLALRGQQGAGVDAIWQRLLHRPVVGADLVTTIDLRLQRAAVEAMGQARGAAVAIDPRSGEVLALVSMPFPDPNRLDAEYERLRKDPGDALFNRATSGLYVPGSTFKLVTFTAALARGVVRPDTVFEDPNNGIVVEHTKIPDPNHPNIPRFDAMHALAYSSNSAFAEMGVKVGGEALREQARKFGFEQPIPFDFPTEASKLANSGNFLRTELGAATTAMGQGQLLASPLQMALVAAGIANRGTIMRPRLVAELRAPDGAPVDRSSPAVLSQATTPEVAAVVRDAMVLGVREAWAKTAALPNVQVAGKTGTGETDADAIPHAWFVAFAPAENPRIAVAVVQEHAGGGSTRAGPVVRRMLEVGLQVVPP